MSNNMSNNMSIYRLFSVTVLITVCITLIVLSGIFSPLYGETPGTGETVNTALIPGDITQIGSYTDFFYNYPADDFFYHLNDRLLFTDKPDGTLLSSGIRNKLMKIVRWHKIIKRSLDRFRTKDTGKTGMITLNVSDPDGFLKAGVLMNLLGLRLEKTPEGNYRVMPDPTTGVTNYFGFAMLNLRTLENQLNKTNLFHFKLAESEVPVPWDFGFLSEVTGLNVNRENFFEYLLKDETFSLFLGVLFRLSHKEIDYIGGLVTSPPLGAWKQVYRDRQFLMGMFILSGALRVNDVNDVNDAGLLLPGGTAAEPFWTHLSGKDPHTAPLAFLHSLATKDDGKLNYLYLFSYFLPAGHRDALFTGGNAKKMVNFYGEVTLKDDEKIQPGRFPRLGDVNPFTFLYSLRMDGSRFNFPTGPDAWLQTLRDKDSVYRIKLLEEGKRTPDGFGVSDALKDTVILLPGGKRIKGTIESSEGEKLVVVANLPVKKNETGDSSAAVFEKTGEEDREMSVTETAEANSPGAEETAGIADPLDSLEIKKDAVYTVERSFIRKFTGKFWPRRRFFVKLNPTYIQPRDSNFKSLYGDRFFYPEVKVGLQFTENLSAWLRGGSISGEAEIPFLQQTAGSTQSFFAFGLGYTIRISKRFHTDIDAGFVNIKFSEEAMNEFVRDSASGFRFDGALSYHVSKWLFTDVSVSYMSADKTIDDFTLKLGGLGAGIGVGVKF